MIAMTPWRWPNFTPAELASPDTGEALMDERTMDMLQALRIAWGRPMAISSGYRTAAHNARVGGRDGSMHLLGKAVDIFALAAEQPRLISLALTIGFRGFGIYPERGFVHIDSRSSLACWTR